MKTRSSWRAVIAAVAVLGTAMAAEATRDEATDLRVTKEAGGTRLEWVAPQAGADTYVVRRCSMRALGISPGACVVQGLTAPTWLDEDDVASVFYLATGVALGAEGALGASFDGHDLTPRLAPDCGAPPDPTPVVVSVRVLEPVELCGTEVRVLYPSELELVDYRCGDLTAGFFGSGSVESPGVALGICAGASGVMAPGGVGEFEFRAGACRVAPAEVVLTTCEYVECVTFSQVPVACELVFP